jgi:tyrosyl-tRNA synthetase
MWRYYELLTDLTLDEISVLREGERNPRDVKVELAKRIIADFHSEAEAAQAEDNFNRVFKRKEIPDEIATYEVESNDVWPLPNLLFKSGLATSVSEARRLIEQGGVRIGGIRQVAGNTISIEAGGEIVFQVGKRRFLRVRGR